MRIRSTRSRTRAPRTPRRTAVALVWIVMTLSLGLAVTGCGGDLDIVGVDPDSNGSREDLETYTDPDYGFSFDYPSDWALQEDIEVEATGGVSAAHSVSVINPEGATAGDYYIDLLEVSVYELSVVIDDSMMPELKEDITEIISGFATEDETWETRETPTEVTVGGLEGYRATAAYDTQGIPTTTSFYFLFNGDVEYELMLQAATENWEAVQADFAAIVGSFEPGTTAGATATTSD